MKKITEKYNVSYETITKLKTYQTLLNEWQAKFNLVSKSSLEDAWNRHFLDSMQLFKYIPDTAKSLADFGSGAGFPGMVLAIMAQEKTPYLKVNLIESTKKKTMYLKEVAAATGTEVNIINDRIENLKGQKFDVITSRAMTSLVDLLGYAEPFCLKDTVCIFPKGRNYAAELAEAHKTWRFKCRIEPSELSPESRILIITDIANKRRK